METSMRSFRSTRPSGQVHEAPTLALVGVAGCRSWLGMSPVARATTAMNYLISKGLTHSPADIDALSSQLDAGCAAAHPPTGPDLAPTCEAWSTLTRTEKLNRIRGFFGSSMGAWVTESDVAAASQQIDDACLAGGVTGTAAEEDARLALQNTRIELTIQPATPLPSDLAVTLDGVPMNTRVLPSGGFDNPSAPVGFELHGLVPGDHTLLITGTGIVSIQQTVAATSGATTPVTMRVQPQPASLRIAVALPPGASPGAVTVTGVPVPTFGGPPHEGLRRQPDGSWTATNVPPGTYDVVATAPGMETQHRSVVLPPGRAVADGFALSYSPASVAVTVTPPNSVATILLDGRPMAQTSANTFSASGVQPGEHVLSATAPGFAPAQRPPFMLTGGQADTFTFALVAVPPVCPSPPNAWSTEQERTDWMAAHVNCPATPYCPSLTGVTFTSEADRQSWINAHSTCTAPAPWVAPDETGVRVAGEASTGSGFKWAAVLAAVLGVGYAVTKRKGKHDEAARNNPARAKSTFQVGDIVKYRAKFLQSVGWYTDVPINGRVEAINDRMQMPSVLWSDRDEPILVHPANIQLASKPDTSGL